MRAVSPRNRHAEAFMRRFWSDREGNIAVLFALAIVPVIGGIGAAVDYSLASAYRTDMQKALDATALALSKVIPLEQDQLDAVALKYFEANFGPHELTNVALTVTPEQGKVRISVSGDYTPKIANIFGATQFKIGTSAEAIWNMGKVEVALVLDSSLSMQNPNPARIEALREATVDLLNVLENAAREPGDAKVGIVPFDGMVNVGASNINENWLRWDWWDANVGSCNMSMGTVPAGTWLQPHCESRTGTTSTCVGASGSSQWRCERNGGTWVTSTTNGVWTSTPRDQWRGCVYDRENDQWPAGASVDFDVLDDAPDATYPYNHASETVEQRQTKYPAAKCYANGGNTPPQQITPLSMDWAALRTKANNLTPTGYTNITIGLAWGFHLLSPTPLLTEGQAYDTEDLTKFVILMTDGENTKSAWKEPRDCVNNASCASELDARTLATCTNIKNAGIKIYTIRLIDGNADLLRDCASSEEMYYDVQDAGALAGVFNAIGSEIASLHLAQ
jgi:Flp pilus assembly protein TadG